MEKCDKISTEDLFSFLSKTSKKDDYKNIEELAKSLCKKLFYDLFNVSEKDVDKNIEELAENIVFGLEYIARITRSENILIHLVELIKKYTKVDLEIVKRIIYKLPDIVNNKKKHIIELAFEHLSTKEIEKSIEKHIISRELEFIYTYQSIFERLSEFKYILEDLEKEIERKESSKIGFIIKTFLNDKIEELIEKYVKTDVEKAKDIVDGIMYIAGYIADHAKDKNIMDFIVETVREYYYNISADIAEKIVSELADIAEFKEEKNILEYSAKIFSYEETKELIKKFSEVDSESAEYIVDRLVDIVEHVRDVNTIKSVIEVIKKYLEEANYKAAKEISYIMTSLIWKIEYKTKEENERKIFDDIMTPPLGGVNIRSTEETSYKKTSLISDEKQKEKYKNSINFAVKFFSNERVIELIKKHVRINDNDAIKIVSRLAGVVTDLLHIASRPESKDLAKVFAYVFSDVKINDLIEKYEKIDVILAKNLIKKLEHIILHIYNNKKEYYKSIPSKFVDVFSDIEIGKDIINNLSDNYILHLLKHSKLIREEGYRGVNKILISKILDIDPTISDFEENIGKRLKEEYGIDINKPIFSKLSNILKSFDKLKYERRKSFRKALELLFEDKYWED
ncbi:MAG: hypothetical protein QW197_01775 [Candidatus Aenigmatarchaeota archaeon]